MCTIIGCYCIPDIHSRDYPALIHDHNLCISNDGSLSAYVHLERFSGIKYDAGLKKSIHGLVKSLGIIPAGEKIFVFVDHEIGRAFLSDSGQIRFEAPLSKTLKLFPEKSRLFWYGEWPEAYVINHELAHIYSCVPFYGMFKENSLLVHFDGGASQSNFSAWKYKNGKIGLVEAGYKYKWLSGLFNANALVFAMVNAKMDEQNSVPGKFMGLEAYGNYRKEIEDWLKRNNFFSTIWASKSIFFDEAKKHFGLKINHIDNKNDFIQDVAATIHHIFIRETLRVFNRIQEKVKAGYLYFSGGSALNIKLNAQLLGSGLFNDIFVPPCTNDSGLSIGAVVAGNIMKNITTKTTDPYLNNYSLKGLEEFSYSDGDIKIVGDSIALGKIIGIANGGGEAGPRALGNRSIVARPDDKKLSVKLSCGCKQREWYRPVAPVMLEHNAQYFTGLKKFPALAEFMLTEFKILPERTKGLEGCVHVDGTSRIQVIKRRGQNRFLYDLLGYIEKDYGIRALINTSFNTKGNPMVQSPDQALKAAKEMKLDGVVCNGKFISLD